MDGKSQDAAAHFIGKWLQREPEMVFAEVFCPAADKPAFRAWGALLHELRESLFELSDPGVARIKTAWWAEELIGLGQGRQRHPLGVELLGRDAPWSALGRALMAHDSDPMRAANTDDAVAVLMPLANAVVQVETELFSARESAEASRSLAIHWLLQRLPEGLASEDQARIPMHLFARHGVTAADLPTAKAQALLRDWADELSSALPPALPGASLVRRARAGFDQARLRRLAAGKPFGPPPPPATLWRAWRAARRS